MARSFALSFSVATKQLYLSLQDIMNTGLSISLSETYAIASDGHIAMALCSLLSSQSLKVGFISSGTIISQLICISISKPRKSRRRQLSQISPPNFTFIPRKNPRITQTRHDGSRGRSFPRWPFQKGHLWARSLHCRLSGTGTPRMRRARLVSEVCILLSDLALTGTDRSVQMYCHRQ
jgi:hypothetical protein